MQSGIYNKISILQEFRTDIMCGVKRFYRLRYLETFETALKDGDYCKISEYRYIYEKILKKLRRV